MSRLVVEDRSLIDEFEDDPALFEFMDETYNIPLWILIKVSMKEAICNASSGIVQRMRLPDQRKYKRIFSNHINAAFHTPFVKKQKDIMVISSNISIVRGLDGKYFDRVLFGYSDSFPKRTITIEITELNGTHVQPMDYYRCYDDIISLYSKHKYGHSLSAKNKKTIDELFEYIKNKTPTPIPEKILVGNKSWLEFRVSRFDGLMELHKKLLNLTEPKSIIMGPLATAGNKPELIHLAKKFGIKTAEVQHGAFVKNAPHYYPLSQMNNPSVLENTTDYFLYWGEYYKSIARTPCKPIVVGNALLESYREHVLPVSECENNILVLSNYTNDTSGLAVDLAKALPDYNITYRQHPSEKRSKKLEEKLSRNRVALDKNQNLYDTLNNHACVVGMESSVFYEAVPLGRKVYHSLVYESRQTDISELFEEFHEIDELVYKIKNNIYKKEINNRFFKPSFVSNYKSYLENQCGIIMR